MDKKLTSLFSLLAIASFALMAFGTLVLFSGCDKKQIDLKVIDKEISFTESRIEQFNVLAAQAKNADEQIAAKNSLSFFSGQIEALKALKGKKTAFEIEQMRSFALWENSAANKRSNERPNDQSLALSAKFWEGYTNALALHAPENPQ